MDRKNVWRQIRGYIRTESSESGRTILVDRFPKKIPVPNIGTGEIIIC